MRKRKASKDAKEKVLLTIRRKVMADFRALIQKKYAKYEKGLLSEEAELALRYWISQHAQAHNSKDLKMAPLNPTPKILNYFLRVKDYLLRKYYAELTPGSHVNFRHLREAIVNTIGGDSRTIKKYLRLFTENKLIRPVAGELWEIL